MITYKKFLEYNNAVKEHLQEQIKLDKALMPFFDPNHFRCHIGDNLLYAFIESAEYLLFDDEDNVIQSWYNWFVFDNDFGKKELEVNIEGVFYKIHSANNFYNLCRKINKDKTGERELYNRLKNPF